MAIVNQGKIHPPWLEFQSLIILISCSSFDYRPTLEEVRMWQDSFDKLMKCKSMYFCSRLSLFKVDFNKFFFVFPKISVGRKVFRDFLKCEYSEENIMFWLACEELKKENDPGKIEEKARIIYEDFISILSPREVRNLNIVDMFHILD